MNPEALCSVDLNGLPEPRPIVDVYNSVLHLERILDRSPRIGRDALDAGYGMDTDFGVDKTPGWLLTQVPCEQYGKPWVRQVVLKVDGGLEVVHDFDCVSEEDIIAAGARGYYRHGELTTRSFSQMYISPKLPYVPHLLGSISMTVLGQALTSFSGRANLMLPR